MALVPQELRELKPTETAISLEKKFSLKFRKTIPEKALYLKYFEKKYDVTIGFQNGTYRYLYLELPHALSKKSVGLYQTLMGQLTDKEKETILRTNAMDTTETKGRTLTVDLPKESMRLEFSNDETNTLQSILLWHPGDLIP